MVRIFLSDGQKIEIPNAKASEVAANLSGLAKSGYTMVEVAPGSWVNPNQVTAVFQVGE